GAGVAIARVHRAVTPLDRVRERVAAGDRLPGHAVHETRRARDHRLTTPSRIHDEDLAVAEVEDRVSRGRPVGRLMGVEWEGREQRERSPGITLADLRIRRIVE